MKKRYLFLVSFLIGLGTYLTGPTSTVKKSVSEQKERSLKVDSSPAVKQLENKSESNEQSSPEEKADRLPASTPPAEWEEKMITNFKHQGGDYIKKVELKPTGVIKWQESNFKINAQSVIVSLTNKNGEESSFKALVDPKTGKVLQTWDRSIFEPVRPWERSEDKLRLDPRHYNF